jgi:hypothetical protein
MKEEQAIKISKTYDGISQLEEYKINSPAKTKEILEHVKSNQKLYQDSIMKKDKLGNLPNIKINLINETYNDIPVVTEIHYTYNTRIPVSYEPTIFDNLSKVFIAICTVFITLLILSLTILSHQNEQQRIEDTCYMYLKNGIPSTIEIDNTVYHLNPDGTIDGIDAVFMNRFHRELLAYQECIKVNIEE